MAEIVHDNPGSGEPVCTLDVYDDNCIWIKIGTIMVRLAPISVGMTGVRISAFPEPRDSNDEPEILDVIVEES